jgi:hypothetical protein
VVFLQTPPFLRKPVLIILSPFFLPLGGCHWNEFNIFSDRKQVHIQSCPTVKELFKESAREITLGTGKEIRKKSKTHKGKINPFILWLVCLKEEKHMQKITPLILGAVLTGLPLHVVLPASSPGCSCEALKACYEHACAFDLNQCSLEPKRVASFCVCKTHAMKDCENWSWLLANCKVPFWTWSAYNKQCAKADLKAAFGKHYDRVLQVTAKAARGK